MSGKILHTFSCIECKMSQLVCLVSKTACFFITKQPELWDKSLLIDWFRMNVPTDICKS